MLKQNNRDKVLQIFFDNPIPKVRGFQLREISRAIKLAPKSVKIYLDKLEETNLIIQKKHYKHNYPVYYANWDNDYFQYLKKVNILKLIKESGLLDYLDETCMPDTIFLFGPTSKGKDSFIHLYLQCDKKQLDLSKYEKELKGKINIFFEKDFNKLSIGVKQDIINGERLKGYLRVEF